MSKKRRPLINYTSRDYTSIRKELLNHVKKYYSSTYKDFNEASFGSLMLDTVSYVGDMLSFYLDYQANESFMDTSIEYENVIRHAKTLGYKFKNSPSSHGVCTFYILVPSQMNSNRPDLGYAPLLEKGTLVSSTEGTTYTLIENVNFADPDHERVVAMVDDSPTSSAPTFFAIKAPGRVISGELAESYETLGDFRRFRKIPLPGENIAEIVSVTDEDGNEYHEVDYLSQDVVFKEVVNKDFTVDSVPSVLKPVAVPRRFIVEQTNTKTYLQFGYGNEDEILGNPVIDPSLISLSVYGKNYVETPTFDPLSLTKTDKFGISPSNTVLRVIYRVNTEKNVNAAALAINTINTPLMYFKNRHDLREDFLDIVRNSLEVENEAPIIGDISLPKTDEIKKRAIDSYASQHRAVTKQDYKSMTYAMPPQFGAVKRCAIYRDSNDLQRALNIHVISEDYKGGLVQTNNTIKRNLKTWLNSVRMISDSIEILDAKVINLGIKYEAITENFENKERILKKANEALIRELTTTLPEIGENFYISSVFKVLKDVEGILDVTSVKLQHKTGTNYHDSRINLSERISKDNRVFMVPKDHLWEIKYPTLDIVGILK